MLKEKGQASAAAPCSPPTAPPHVLLLQGSSGWLSGWEGDPEGMAKEAPSLACSCPWVLVPSVNPVLSSLSPSAPLQCKPVRCHAFTGVGGENRGG